jgi:hypothetical protein
MAITFNKFNAFPVALGTKVHNLAADSLKVALTNTIPTATMTALANLTEISYTNLSSRAITTTSYTQTSGLAKLIIADLTLVATGTVPTFQYIVLYNDTATNKELIGWYDNGSAVNLTVGTGVLLDFDQSNGCLSVQ